MSVLALRWRHREAGKASMGTSTSARDWLDFIVDGESLADLLGVDTDNQIGFLGWMRTSQFSLPNDEQKLWDELLLDKPSSLYTGRARLYVCAECGHDIGCGAVTAVVKDEGGTVEWGEFGFEQDPPLSHDPIVKYEGLQKVGPFTFERDQYREALTKWPTKPMKAQ